MVINSYFHSLGNRAVLLGWNAEYMPDFQLQRVPDHVCHDGLHQATHAFKAAFNFMGSLMSADIAVTEWFLVKLSLLSRGRKGFGPWKYKCIVNIHTCWCHTVWQGIVQSTQKSTAIQKSPSCQIALKKWLCHIYFIHAVCMYCSAEGGYSGGRAIPRNARLAVSSILARKYWQSRVASGARK